MSTGRLGSFSDGVFAIAATLLILDVRAVGRPLGYALVHIWPSYVAYAVSFVTIGIMWINHHTIIEQVDRVDRTFLVFHVLFLMVVAFIPFPTGLVATHLRTSGIRAATLAYGITLTITAAMFSVIWFYAARHRRLLRSDADPRVVSGISRSFIPGPYLYLTATLVALVSPTTSLVLFLAFAVFYVFESSIFGRTADDAT